MAKKKPRAAGSNAKPRNVRSAQTDRRNVRSAQNPAPITPIKPNAIELLSDSLRDTADQFGRFRAIVFGHIGLPVVGDDAQEFARLVALLKDLTDPAIICGGITPRAGSLADAICTMRRKLIQAQRAANNPHDKPERVPGANGEPTKAATPPTDWYSAEEWRASLLSELPDGDGGLFTISAVAQLLAGHCNQALAKGWEMFAAQYGWKADEAPGIIAWVVDRLEEAKAMKSTLIEMRRNVLGNIARDAIAYGRRNSSAEADAQFTQKIVTEACAICQVDGEKLLREGAQIEKERDRLLEDKQALQQTKGLCNCHNSEPCPLGRIGMEHRCSVDELQNLANIQATALRDCEHLIEKGFEVRIGDAWPALVEPMKAAKQAIITAQGLAKRQLKAFRLSELTDAHDAMKRIAEALAEAKFDLSEAPDIDDHADLAIQAIRRDASAMFLKGAAMPVKLTTTVETAVDPQVQALRDALAVFRDYGKRIAPVVDYHKTTSLTKSDLRLFDGHKLLLRMKIQDFERAIEAFDATAFKAEPISQDMAETILIKSKRVANRIQAAGCWQADFVADVVHEEFGPFFAADTFGAANKVVADRNQANEAVLTMQRAIGIMGLPEALDRISILTGIRSALAQKMEIPVDEVFPTVVMQWAENIKTSLATAEETRRTIRADLGLRDGESILYAINEHHEKAKDFDRIAQAAASRGLREDESILHWLAHTCDRADRATRFFIQLQAITIAFRQAVKLLRQASPMISTQWAAMHQEIQQFMQSQDPASDVEPFKPGDQIECRSPRYTDGKPARGQVDVCEQYDTGIWFVRYHDQANPPSMLYDRADECVLLQVANYGSLPVVTGRKVVSRTELQRPTDTGKPGA